MKKIGLDLSSRCVIWKKNAIKQYLFIHPYYIHSCQIFNYFLESPSFDKIRKFTFNNISIIINSWYVNCMRLSVFETKTKWKKQTISSKNRLLKIVVWIERLIWEGFIHINPVLHSTRINRKFLLYKTAVLCSLSFKDLYREYCPHSL